MAKIMVIAGGEWQTPLVKKAKDLGHYVLCTNLYQDSPAFKYADQNEVADVLDKKRNLEIAKKFKPDVVLTDQSDIAVPTVAFICDKLGLKGIGLDKAILFTNKYRMREFEKKNRLAFPFYYGCENYGDVLDAFNLISSNIAIIKPVDSQSSRGVFLINKTEDNEDKFNKAKIASSSHKVIFEEFIDGVEFTVDGLKLNDKYFTLAISRKKHYSHNPQIASDLFFSWDDEEYDYRQLELINRQHIEKSGLPFGLTHSEYKYYKGQFYLIEMAARGGGTLISSNIAPFMSGIDGPEELIKYLTNDNSHLFENKKNKVALLHFFDFSQGKVLDIKGVSEIQRMDGINKFKLDFKIGDYIQLPDNDRGRVGFVIIFGSSKDDVLTKLRQVENTLVVTVKA